MLTVDPGDAAVLGIIAFETIDHKILITQLECLVWIWGIVLNWFQSYITNRGFTVTLGEFVSSSASFIYGVPQGPILGPIMFSLYIYRFIKKNGASFHCQ